jgi:excisionase family DNA binding protein
MQTENLKVSQVAEILGVSKATVHRLIEKGHFPGSYRVDPTGLRSHVIIPKSDVDEFLKKRRSGRKNGN